MKAHTPKFKKPAPIKTKYVEIRFRPDRTIHMGSVGLCMDMALELSEHLKVRHVKGEVPYDVGQAVHDIWRALLHTFAGVDIEANGFDGPLPIDGAAPIEEH